NSRQILFALRPVPEALPGGLADAIAFIPLGEQPCLIQVGRGQQAVREQEPGEVARVTPLGPDEALKQLLVIGYRALAAQVERDDHVQQRHCLWRAKPEYELLVGIGHRQARAGVALEVTAD